MSDASRDDFVQFQAILSSLPKSAVPPSTMRTCTQWNQFVTPVTEGQRSANQRLFGVDSQTCIAKVNEALFKAARLYPSYAESLRRLSVEHASVDIVVLADHDQRRLHVAARGTDKNYANLYTFPRDWNNNLFILLGWSPGRAHGAIEEYRTVRTRYPTYTVYGCGHSLGGAVALQLARLAEEDASIHFYRLDLFDPAISPFGSPYAQLERTDIHVHRVPYDWASIGLAWGTTPNWCQLHMHPVKPHVSERHALSHFLPEKVNEAMSQPLPFAIPDPLDGSSSQQPPPSDAQDAPGASSTMQASPTSSVADDQSGPVRLHAGEVVGGMADEPQAANSNNGLPHGSPSAPLPEGERLACTSRWSFGWGNLALSCVGARKPSKSPELYASSLSTWTLAPPETP